MMPSEQTDLNFESSEEDCFGDVLYEVSAEWTTDLDSDGMELPLGSTWGFGPAGIEMMEKERCVASVEMECVV